MFSSLNTANHLLTFPLPRLQINDTHVKQKIFGKILKQGLEDSFFFILIVVSSDTVSSKGR